MFSRMMFGGNVVNPLPGGYFGSSGSPNASSTLRVSADGWIRHVDNGTPYQRHLWHTGGGNTSLYVRFTLISGDTPNIGTLNTWQQLNTDRDIGNSRSTPGTRSSVIRVQIATDSGGTNIVSTSSPDYTVEAEVFI